MTGRGADLTNGGGCQPVVDDPSPECRVSAQDRATERCPECGGTGRVPRRDPCGWCGEGVAEHACEGCDCRLCEECVFEGRCPHCNPQAYMTDVFGFLPGEALS